MISRGHRFHRKSCGANPVEVRREAGIESETSAPLMLPVAPPDATPMLLRVNTWLNRTFGLPTVPKGPGVGRGPVWIPHTNCGIAGGVALLALLTGAARVANN